MQRRLKYFEQALDIRKKILGDEHIKTIHTMHHMGCIRCEIKELRKADEILQYVLKKKTEILGGNAPDVGKVMIDIARVEFFKKNYIQANVLCQNASQIFEKALLPDIHPYVEEVNSRMQKLQPYLNLDGGRRDSDSDSWSLHSFESQDKAEQIQK